MGRFLKVLGRSLPISLLVLFSFQSILASDADRFLSYDQLATVSPRELHRSLAQSKREAFEQMRRLAATAGEASAEQEAMDVSYYKLRLHIDELDRLIYGRVTIRASVVADDFSQAVFDLHYQMNVDSIFDRGVHTTAWTHDDNLLIIDLDSTYGAGEEFEVEVVYHGRPGTSGPRGLRFDSHDGVPVIATHSEPFLARTWWPCKDRPDDKADSVDIFVEVNSDFFVSSNGILRDSIGHGPTTTYWWHEQYPITTYLVSLAASNYRHFRRWYNYSMPVDFYAYPELYPEAERTWPETVEMIAFFADAFGEYPFVAEKYAMTHYSRSGAMEHQTNTSMTSGPYGFYRFLIAHELAHQWWGDYITCRSWNHIWLNEGFASYSEALYAEHLGGADSLQGYMKNMEYLLGGTIYVYDTSSAAEIFNVRVYDKGAWVLHMLRGVLGDAAFFAGLAEYAASPEFAYGNATTEDFQSVCEAVSGIDLDFFIEQWIYDEYYPIYHYSCLQDSLSDQVSIVIRQTQEYHGYRPVFEMPIHLKFDFADGGDTTIAVWNDQAEQTFEIDLSQTVENISFDPNNWILKRAYSDNVPPAATGKVTAYPNPFAETIRFAFPKGIPPGPIQMRVYSVAGELVFVHEIHDWIYDWDGRNNAGERLAGGVYVCFFNTATAEYSIKVAYMR